MRRSSTRGIERHQLTVTVDGKPAFANELVAFAQRDAAGRALELEALRRPGTERLRNPKRIETERVEPIERSAAQIAAWIVGELGCIGRYEPWDFDDADFVQIAHDRRIRSLEHEAARVGWNGADVWLDECRLVAID